MTSKHKPSKYWHREEIRMTISHLPEELQGIYYTNCEKLRELLWKDESTLRSMAKPTATINAMRINFWNNIDFQSFKKETNNDTVTQMSMSQLCKNICYYSHGIKLFEEKPIWIAWILKPPLAYDRKVEECLDLSITRMRELLDLPLYDEDGSVDKKNASVIMKAIDKVMSAKWIVGNAQLIREIRLQRLQSGEGEDGTRDLLMQEGFKSLPPTENSDSKDLNGMYDKPKESKEYNPAKFIVTSDPLADLDKEMEKVWIGTADDERDD